MGMHLESQADSCSPLVAWDFDRYAARKRTTEPRNRAIRLS